MHDYFLALIPELRERGGDIDSDDDDGDDDGDEEEEDFKRLKDTIYKGTAFKL